MLERESDKTTPSLTNQDMNTGLEDKQPWATQDTHKEGSQHMAHERESDTTTPSLANHDMNTDLEDKHPWATRDTDKEGSQHTAHERESDTSTPSLGNQGTDTGQKGNQHIVHETVTVQGNDTSTSESEKVNPQGYQQAPPRLLLNT